MPQPGIPLDVLERVRGAYRSQSVLITGGASFIGSHLTEALVDAGAEVTVADDLSSGRQENLRSVRDRIRFLRSDLRDEGSAEEACASQDVVFHLAAAHGGRGYIDTHPVECLGNMALDHSVFSAAVKAGVGRIVYASSACVYPTLLQADDRKRTLLREDDAGFDRPGAAFCDGEYGWYKLMGELQLQAFHKQFGIDGIACRIFTAYGERENESHAAIALIAKAVARMDPYPIWGDGLQTRNFTYVGDTVSGILLSGMLLSRFDVINVGIDEHFTINEVLEVIFQSAGWRPRSIERQLDRPVGVRARAADTDKCDRLLAWRPRTSLIEGVDRTFRWYQESVSQERLDELNSLLMVR